MLDKNAVLRIVKNDAFPALRAERTRTDRIDKWYRWSHDKPHVAHGSSTEYKDLADRAQAPWGRRVVTAVTDQLYIEGYRGKGEGEDATAWTWWQANGLDARQIAVHEAAVAYGLAYTVVLPGRDPLTGSPMPVIRGLDPSQMIAFYEDPAWDTWPVYALRAEGAKFGKNDGFNLRLYDQDEIHHLTCNAEGGNVEYLDAFSHDAGVCPVTRFANHIDLRSRADGEVDPFIPLLGRIDQTTFDRLVVQRFASFVVRTVTGMSPPDELDDESVEEWRRRTALMLKVGDLLAAEDSATEFGSLPATPLDGFINAHDADIRALAAVSQTPVNELLGQLSNVSAEGLAAAEAALTRKVESRKHTLGESWEQTLRLGAHIMGDRDGAENIAAQVRWKDMESRSLAQAADALGKLAQMLGVPVEVLWEKIPGFTQQDIERAKQIRDEGGPMDQLMREIERGLTGPTPEPEPAPAG